MFCNDGGLRDDDARTCVFKLGVDADVFSLTESLPVNLSADGHLAVRYEHTGDFLLFTGCSWSLRTTQLMSDIYYYLKLLYFTFVIVSYLLQVFFSIFKFLDSGLYFYFPLTMFTFCTKAPKHIPVSET